MKVWAAKLATQTAIENGAIARVPYAIVQARSVVDKPIVVYHLGVATLESGSLNYYQRLIRAVCFDIETNSDYNIVCLVNPTVAWCVFILKEKRVALKPRRITLYTTCGSDVNTTITCYTQDI